MNNYWESFDNSFHLKMIQKYISFFLNIHSFESKWNNFFSFFRFWLIQSNKKMKKKNERQQQTTLINDLFLIWWWWHGFSINNNNINSKTFIRKMNWIDSIELDLSSLMMFCARKHSKQEKIVYQCLDIFFLFLFLILFFAIYDQ